MRRDAVLLGADRYSRGGIVDHLYRHLDMPAYHQRMSVDITYLGGLSRRMWQ